MSLRVVAPASSMGVHEGVHTVFSRCSEILVGAPRFELGTPCTPCKCATRLRHAPIRLFFLKDLSTRLGKCHVPSANHTLFSDSLAAASAPQDSHQLFELDPHLLHDLLALRHVRTRLL